ncbi:dTMP kinase [Advenella mimigardefordensis]|uniref:Thymidylate kinase n=1 Tax=Advenella mimigardefordensis (strain DSM 17166 / LMG 22922 / DPN7) TaxID=1247726 RepID=W0PFG7_ADVMD|nr:dTMP kinase [Advenella mimigardefordensis]AHG64040.1 thymidylate kinase [Advenella mimigardefordensis DPN7]
MKGFFLTLEGVDGAGKSSHIGHLRELCESLGHEVVMTREPGGTPISEALRAMLLKESMHMETETLLMFAARQEHILSVIAPALASGKIVISDRFTDATYAYQGGGRHFPAERIQILENWVQQQLQPDLTILFDVPLEVARERLEKSREQDRFEREGSAFFERVRAAYHARVSADPGRFYTVDSSRPKADITQQLQDLVKTRLAQHAAQG